MDAKETIKRLPEAIRERLERYREDSAVLRPTSGEEYFNWYEHLSEIEGYTTALCDAAVITKDGLRILQRYCMNEED